MATCKLYQALTVSTAVVSPTAPISGCSKFVMAIEGAATANIRWRADGIPVTSTVGAFAAPGKDYIFDFEPKNMTLIRDTGSTTDAVVHFHYLMS